VALTRVRFISTLLRKPLAEVGYLPATPPGRSSGPQSPEEVGRELRLQLSALQLAVDWVDEEFGASLQELSPPHSHRWGPLPHLPPGPVLPHCHQWLGQTYDVGPNIPRVTLLPHWSHGPSRATLPQALSWLQQHNLGPLLASLMVTDSRGHSTLETALNHWLERELPATVFPDPESLPEDQRRAERAEQLREKYKKNIRRGGRFLSRRGFPVATAVGAPGGWTLLQSRCWCLRVWALERTLNPVHNLGRSPLPPTYEGPPVVEDGGVEGGEGQG